MLITKEYQDQNKLLHIQNKDYGGGGQRRKKDILPIIAKYKPESILDYGCGKGLLAKSMSQHNWQEYDPCIPGKNSLPTACDLVVCCDVLEHVEPELIENVIEHIKILTNKVAFFCIGLRPANKTLPDGRNTHISLFPKEKWLGIIHRHFCIIDHRGSKGKFFITGEPFNDSDMRTLVR